MPHLVELLQKNRLDLLIASHRAILSKWLALEAEVQQFIELMLDALRGRHIRIPYGQTAYFPTLLNDASTIMVNVGDGVYVETQVKYAKLMLARRVHFIRKTIHEIEAKIQRFEQMQPDHTLPPPNPVNKPAAVSSHVSKVLETQPLFTPEFFEKIKDTLNVRYYEMDQDDLKDRPGLRSAGIQQGTVDGETFMDIREEYTHEADVRYAPPEAIREEMKRDKQKELHNRQTPEAKKQQESFLGEILAVESPHDTGTISSPASVFTQVMDKHVSFVRGDVAPPDLRPDHCKASSHPTVASNTDQITIKAPADINFVMSSSSSSISTNSITEDASLKPDSSISSIELPSTNSKPLKSAIKYTAPINPTNPNHLNKTSSSNQSVINARQTLAAQTILRQKDQIIKTKVLEKELPPPPPIQAKSEEYSTNDWSNQVLTDRDLVALSEQFQQIPASLVGGIPSSKRKSRKNSNSLDSDSDSYDDDDDDDDDMEMVNRIQDELAEYETAYSDQVIWADNDSENASDGEPADWKPEVKEPPKLKWSASTSNSEDDVATSTESGLAKPAVSRFKLQRMNKLDS
ncbi:hypothetical protein SeMB42_g07814 [Synchytrium endobioticum]|uniref:Uncharacterized protein n=1 Tax=Synchytrium endobioticum TaxID=286115 RepID=A0A507DEK0_9FUNG|nr:hypothetical protein SeMB42_g07814 [Synchytrium endobioticum]TPX49745.1 hypothetical protein SeLEV6574_g01300 [Synchytrium endobioticum]